ncbi:MAG: sulfotransferase domain-containing protein, partial [Promethearchaeota archaeon]
VVRNPRDRGVSLAFHNRYHENNPGNFKESKLATDFDAVKFTVMGSSFECWNKNQEYLMWRNHSTHSDRSDNKLPYIWTSYEWLLSDTYREVKAILDFIGSNASDLRVKQMIKNHSFKSKSARNPGDEDRRNNWRRKGVMLDWINWYDSDMAEHTKDVQEKYWELLIRSQNKNG